MQAIVVQNPGKESSLSLKEVQSPNAGPGEVRIKICATAVNRADLLQRRGLYPPPTGASAIMGLECAGVIEQLGPNVTQFSLDQPVMALLPGGGYAEYAVVDTGSVLPIPPGMRFEEAAGLMETHITAYLNLFELGRSQSGETALIHGGGGGVGTAAITLCQLRGIHTLVTCGSPAKCLQAKDHGATLPIPYKETPFRKAVESFTQGNGVEVILDCIGAAYLSDHLDLLKPDGRLILIGLMGGAKADISLAQLLKKRIELKGSVLRPLSTNRKEGIIRRFCNAFGHDLQSGRIRPKIHCVLPLAQADQAHQIVKESSHFGKVVLSLKS